jgi:hypothetical protein
MKKTLRRFGVRGEVWLRLGNAQVRKVNAKLPIVNPRRETALCYRAILKIPTLTVPRQQRLQALVETVYRHCLLLAARIRFEPS